MLLCVSLFLLIGSILSQEQATIFVTLGFELRALNLLGRHSTACHLPPDLSALVILEIGSHFLSR
jgi:hypothetical protein